MIPVMIGITIISATPQKTTCISGHGPPWHVAGEPTPKSPWLKMKTISRGFTTPRPDVITISSPTIPTLPRYGRKVLTTRFTVARSTGFEGSSAGDA